MSIIRAPRPDKGWVAIPNATIRDRRLSWKDRGILAYILSLPDEAETTIANLTEAGPDGTDGTRAALKRLADCGYVKRVKTRLRDGTWATQTYVYDTPEAAKQAAANQESLDIPAGRSQGGFSGVDDESSDISAGQNQVGFTDTAEPTRLSRTGKHPSKELRPLGEDQPSNAPPAEPAPADVLAAAILDGLAEADADLASRVGRAAVLSVCPTLLHLGWEPLTIARWAEHAGWVGAGPGAVIQRLKDLGRPPERPRSGEPLRQDECPEHEGQPIRAGSCDLCIAESRRVDPSVAVARLRATTRRSAPATDPRGLTLLADAAGGAS